MIRMMRNSDLTQCGSIYTNKVLLQRRKVICDGYNIVMADS